MIIGCHCNMSMPLMLLGSVQEAISYGANALMVYTGAPQNTNRKPVEYLMINEAMKLMEESNIKEEHLIIHAPYIVNLSSADELKHEFSVNFLTQEIIRVDKMHAKYMVVHPGNHLDLDNLTAIKNTCSVINEILKNTSDLKTTILIETMAGKGSEIGRNFNEVKLILDGVVDQSRIGVCLDTCHLFDSGYDLINNYDEVICQLDKEIGINKVKVIHVNDSKNGLGSHKDRHANIGQGFIGLDTLKRICEDERFSSVPKILETPYIDGNPPYKEEIALLREKNN